MLRVKMNTQMYKQEWHQTSVCPIKKIKTSIKIIYIENNLIFSNENIALYMSMIYIGDIYQANPACMMANGKRLKTVT